jgi:hypothetical protein
VTGGDGGDNNNSVRKGASSEREKAIAAPAAAAAVVVDGDDGDSDRDYQALPHHQQQRPAVRVGSDVGTGGRWLVGAADVVYFRQGHDALAATLARVAALHHLYFRHERDLDAAGVLFADGKGPRVRVLMVNEDRGHAYERTFFEDFLARQVFTAHIVNNSGDDGGGGGAVRTSLLLCERRPGVSRWGSGYGFHAYVCVRVCVCLSCHSFVGTGGTKVA